MLIKQAHLKEIKDGRICLIFRKWRSSRVKKGSLIKTSVGQLEINRVREVSRSQLKLSDAQQAGYRQLPDLLKSLDQVANGKIFEIQVSYHSPDPRIELRNQVDIPEPALRKLIAKLQKLDKLSRQGPWVISVLTAIRDYPKLRAAELSEQLGFPKDWLKINIRKLKNLGLSISHQAGYSLSPRGEKVLFELGNRS